MPTNALNDIDDAKRNGKSIQPIQQRPLANKFPLLFGPKGYIINLKIGLTKKLPKGEIYGIGELF